MKRKAEIFSDLTPDGGIDVVVTDKRGAEVFRRPKTAQTVRIANTIYMYEEYHEQAERVGRLEKGGG